MRPVSLFTTQSIPAVNKARSRLQASSATQIVHVDRCEQLTAIRASRIRISYSFSLYEFIRILKCSRFKNKIFLATLLSSERLHAEYIENIITAVINNL